LVLEENYDISALSKEQKSRRRGKKAMECKHIWRLEGGKERERST
jgi:hypothetical protein